jgi:hypothetical protein
MFEIEYFFQNLNAIDKTSVDCIVVPGHLLPTFTQEDWE